MNPWILQRIFSRYNIPRGFKDGINQMGDRVLTQPGETLIGASHRLGVVDLGELKQQNKTYNASAAEPQVIRVSGPPEILPPEVKRIIVAMERAGYVVNKDDTKNYNLNIVGLRNNSTESNRFDDELWVFWKYENRWSLKKFKITTDPGLSWLQAPGRKEGTAILKEGQYKDSHQLGKHRGQYEALVQASPVTVIRDFNRDNKLDFSSGKTQTGIFGINIHRANEKVESQLVNKWSAGCQVFANPNEFEEFMKLCKLRKAEWGDRFTYTLLKKESI